MNSLWIDIPVLLILIFGIIRGLRNGIVKELAAILALIVGIWAGFRLAFLFAGYYKDHFELPQKTIPVIAFLTAFILAMMAVLLIGRMLRFTLEKTNLSMPDKLLGGVFGAAKVAFLAGTLMVILCRLKPEIANDSLSCRPLQQFAKGVNEYSISLVPAFRNILTEADSFFIDLESKSKTRAAHDSAD